MNTTIIVVLTLILLFLLILNNVSITLTSNNTQQIQAQQPNGNQGRCSQTAYGCCPDGVNSKIDFNGTNCPSYNPGPGYKV